MVKKLCRKAVFFNSSTVMLLTFRACYQPGHTYLYKYLVFGLCLFWYLAHAFFGIWFMPFWDLVHAFLEFGSCLFWYLVHAFLGFGSCLFEIWLMPFLVFGSRLFGIWLMPFWNLAHAYLSAQVKEFNENSQEPNLIGFFLNCAQVKTAPLKTA